MIPELIVVAVAHGDRRKSSPSQGNSGHGGLADERRRGILQKVPDERIVPYIFPPTGPTPSVFWWGILWPGYSP